MLILTLTLGDFPDDDTTLILRNNSLAVNTKIGIVMPIMISLAGITNLLDLHKKIRNKKSRIIKMFAKGNVT